MNSNLVIFVSTPLIKRDIEMYGVEYFKNNGVEVWFLNFWPLFAKGLTHKADIEYNNQIHIDSLSTLFRVLRELKKQKSKFLSDIAITHKTFILYLILTLLNIEYSFADNWYVIQPKRNNKRIVIEKFGSIIRTIIRPSRQIKKIIFKYLLIKPRFVFMPNKRSYHAKAILGKKSLIIPYASFNYDDFIQADSEDNKKQLTKDNYFVFIDQYLTNLPDFARSGIKTPLTNKYYNSLNRFFKDLSIEYRMDCMIASHPRRNIEELNEFETKDVYLYRTFQLIKNANFIVAHYSFSIYWAILLNKPILFISTNEMKGTFIESSIKTFAAELKQNILNIDTDILTQKGLILDIDQHIYDQFICNHIVYNPDNKMKTYEIIHKILYLS